MAAGLGFKTFNTGDVLSAADVNGYLMQGILVFASATARDAAITSPQEGQFAFLKDTNVTTYYTGSAWANVDTTGMTNPMTTTGDVIYSSSGSTPARLGIGTAGQVLQVNSGATAPEWATPATSASGLTFISATTMSSAASQAVNPFSATYDNYLVLVTLTGGGNGGTTKFQFRNGVTNRTSAYYSGSSMIGYNGTTNSYAVNNGSTVDIVGNSGDAGTGGQIIIWVSNVNNSGYPSVNGQANQGLYYYVFGGTRNATETNDGFLLTSSSSMTGSIRVYGVKKS
jgi:hypothetical protein